MRFSRAILMMSILVGLASVASAAGTGAKATTGSAKGEMAKSAMAKGGMAKGDIAATLEAMENKVMEAIKSQDSKTFLSLVDPDGMSVDATGFTTISAFAGMMPDIVIKNYSFEGYKVKMIDKGAYLATFTWKGDGSYKGQAFPPVTYASTIWAKRGTGWKAIFHQESMPMPGGMEAPAAGSH